ncbi:MAG: CDP-alcohol phosphatidyltransferase family protein [Candidatus Bathyarchaeia archaeon]
MLTKLKRKVQEIVSAEARLIHKAGLKPNIVSAMGAILGLLSGIAYWAAGVSLPDLNAYRIHLSTATVLLMLSGFSDALDGALARIYGEATVMGGFLDSLLDRYVDSAVLCGLILGGLCDNFWGFIALVGSLLTSYVRARSEAADVPMETVGVMERAERIIVIIAASIVSAILAETIALKFSIMFLAVASNLTVVQRTLYFRRRVRQKR